MPKKPREVIRAFIALDLDSTSLRRVARVADRLRMGSGAPSATWVAPVRMHVTLKFVAELPTDAVTPLGDALQPIVEGKSAPAPSAIVLDAFPSVDAASVVIVALDDASSDIAKLAEQVDAIGAKLGLPKAETPLRPHVTLARLKRPYDARRWLRAELANAGKCRAASLTLYHSHRSAEGEPAYVPLARFPFAQT